MHMRKYSVVALIYNPNSTGNRRGKIKDLQSRLETKLSKTPIVQLPTEYAGHAEKLAYETAKAYKKPLLVSVSGDGGYHELVNGAMRAKAEGHDSICAVFPAGNANDHARTMHRRPLLYLIRKKKVRKLDLLKISLTKKGKTRHSYAHSYIGWGLTPHVAEELNKRELNHWQEVVAFMQSFWAAEPVRVSMDGKECEYDSLVCSTIPEMGKILKLSRKAKPNDGKFEVHAIVHESKSKLLRALLKGTFLSMVTDKQQKRLDFTVLNEALMQLDGELETLTADTKVSVTIERRVLRTIA